MSLFRRKKAKGPREFALPIWSLFLGILLAVPTVIVVIYGVLKGLSWLIRTTYDLISENTINFGLTSALMIAISLITSYITIQEANPTDKQRKVILITCGVVLALGIILAALTGYVDQKNS